MMEGMLTASHEFQKILNSSAHKNRTESWNISTAERVRARETSECNGRRSNTNVWSKSAESKWTLE